MAQCCSGWRKPISYSMLTTTVAALLCCCITYTDGKRSRGHTWPTMSFFPPCRIPPRAMVSVPSLMQTFSEPISMKYHHTNFPSVDEHADINNAPISYGGILNLHQSINISGLEAQHVLEQVDIFFDEIKTENIVWGKSSIRRHRLRVTNNHGADGLTIPSYVSYDGRGMHKFNYNVTLGVNYWIYLTLDSGSLDQLNGKKTLEIHFIGLTKDNNRRFNVIQHTTHRVESDADEDMIVDQLPNISTEVESDGTIRTQTENEDPSVESQSVIPSKADLITRMIKYYMRNPLHDASMQQVRTNGKLKVMSFNVWNTNPPQWVYPTYDERVQRYNSRMQLLANVIKSADPDIVGFQEVRYDSDMFTNGGARQSRSKSNFQLQHILNLLNEDDDGESSEKYKYFVWQPSMLYFNPQNLGQRVEEGAAIISKYPILSTDYMLLPRFLDDNDDRQHQRVSLHAKILIPTYGIIDVFTTHLSLSENARIASVRALWEFIEANAASNEKTYGDLLEKRNMKSASILLGDLNSEPQSYDMQYLSKHLTDFWLVKNTEPEPRSKDPELREHAFTFPSDDPKKRIDYMLGYNFDIKKDFHSIELLGQSASEDTRNDPGHGMLDSDSPMWASDHRAVMLTINTHQKQ